MANKIKVLVIALGVLVAAAGVVMLTGNGQLLTGRFDKEVAFFRGAPEKDTVINSTFLSYRQVADMFIPAALNAKRITQAEATELASAYAFDAKASRADVAAMAVAIFKLNENVQGGPRVTDVNPRSANAQPIYTCIAHGCLDIEFKPTNQATADFVQRISGNLQAVFKQ